METMSYNKINKKKSNYGIYGFFTFIILGTGIIFYSIVNEPTPVILGQDPLKNVTIYEDADTVSSENVSVEYSIVDKSMSETSGNFKTNITMPVISVAGEELADINNEIEKYFSERSNALKEQMAGKVENKFTYKVTYKVYENSINDNKILSITIHERIVDNAAGTTTTDRVNGYNVDLAKRKLMTQEEAAVEVLGSNYFSLIKDQIKETVVGAKMINNDDYKYNVTGLEQFYIKDGKFHVLLNENEVVDKAYGVVDVEITK